MADGYGAGSYGTSPYGVGNEDAPAGILGPQILPLDPVAGAGGISSLKPISFRIKSSSPIAFGTLRVSVGSIDWVLGGGQQNGAVLSSESISGGGFDVEIIPPAPYENGSRQEVAVHVSDVDDLSKSFVYFFSVGIGPRLIMVRNPIDGLLLAHFNQPMKLDSTFFFPGNWKITPVSEGAAPITVTEIVASAAQPDVAHIRHRGGGSTYLLTTLGILGVDGSPLDPGFASINFNIVFEEEEAPQIRLFDSVFGPLGVSQRVRKRRTLDDFTANRSIALGLDEQFRLRFQQLDGSVGRDGRDGKRRV